MIVIDDNMLRLAKMQETLLKVSVDNREENVLKYCQMVTNIDKQVFSSLLDYISEINKHNHTYEEELDFLEQIKSNYEQVKELQFNFKNVSDNYGGVLKLSDLSSIDIEYISYRISALSGYLINNKNLEINKDKLRQLNEDLIVEQKNNKKFVELLKRYEELLRDIFLNSEGRTVVGGKLTYTSVVSEFEKIGYDFKQLLYNSLELDKLLEEVTSIKNDSEAKLKTAEICYNAVPSYDSKAIYDDINKEYLADKYKFIMLKILQLLSKDYDSYDLIISKRNDLIDLVNGRISCLNGLGVTISYDAFSVNKIMEQLDEISKIQDNSKIISNLMKEIAELTERIENMESQTGEYLRAINDVRDIVVSNIGFSDIDVSSVVLDFDVEENKKEVLPNQVIDIKDVSKKFNMLIVKQKTRGVIKRVCEMVKENHIEEIKEDVIDIVPELVIVSPSINLNDDNRNDVLNNEDLTLVDELRRDDIEEVSLDEIKVDVRNKRKADLVFETVTPFEDAPLFLEKSDDLVDLSKTNISLEENVEEVKNVSFTDEVMPDLFWEMSDDVKEEKISDGTLSFDEQIDVLLSSEESTKTKKKVA